VIVVGIVLSYFGNELDDVFIRKSHDSVSSGPLTVTQYKHKLGEDVFFLIRDLKLTDKGTIRVYTPEGIEFKTIFYDGSFKQNFNQFFFPDTFAKIYICTPDQLVGIWRAVFEDGSYAPLEFEVIDEYIGGGEALVTIVC